eukprot:SAG22_NODE_4397_length_1282_cov_6.540152_2_plen_73_part_00
MAKVEAMHSVECARPQHTPAADRPQPAAKRARAVAPPAAATHYTAALRLEPEERWQTAVFSSDSSESEGYGW